MTTFAIRIQVCSDLDYDNLIAEIYAGEKFIGLLSNEPCKALCFEIPDNKGGFSAIELECFKRALEDAKKQLLQED